MISYENEKELEAVGLLGSWVFIRESDASGIWR